MNLTTESWIPVVWNDGHAGRVSLREAFDCGEEIRDLAVRPHERVAVMRLLICIAQAALDGPSTEDDWSKCSERLGPSVLTYIGHWQHAFELFGNGQRFLQVVNLAKTARKSSPDDEEGTAASKLNLALATGNNPTLFDNGGGFDRAFTPHELALMLITFQCFSPGGRIGVALWDGQETCGGGSSDHAPCLAAGMIHALVRGDNLVTTIRKNLMTREQVALFYGPDRWGKPLWEMMPRRLDDAAAVRNATRTYLGRLLPLTRALLLNEDGRSLILANGLSYESYDESGWREPTATVIARTLKGTEKRIVLPASVEKALWRELYALTVRTVGEQPGGPAALQHLPDEQPFDLWIGTLLADQAKPVDTVESVFHLPGTMLDPGSQLRYEEGVKYAEGAEGRLRRAISTYRIAIESSEKDLDGIRRKLGALKKADRDKLRQFNAKALQQFWTDTELAVPRLLEISENPQQFAADFGMHETRWNRAVISAMRAAYESACPHDTPRQIRAYSFGLRVLFPKPTTSDNAEIEEEAKA